MILLMLILFHEYVAKRIIPYYKLKFEAREAANRFTEMFCLHSPSYSNEKCISFTVQQRL